MLRRHGAPMVVRTRVREVLTVIGLYAAAALIIGYFGINAYTGAHGLKAKKDLVAQLHELSDELARLEHERRDWENRVQLLRSDRLDPDMLDERARVMLGYAGPDDLILASKTK
jgi:cell division protein FtsB